MPRSAERQAEINAQDRVEAAFQAVDALPEPARSRVRAWAAQEYAWPLGGQGGGNGAVTADRAGGQVGASVSDTLAVTPASAANSGKGR